MEPRTCPIDGVPLKPYQQVYCSHTCSNSIRKLPPRSCERPGCTNVLKKGAKHYCGSKCSALIVAPRRPKPPPKPFCVVCGVNRVKRWTTKHCSDKCKGVTLSTHVDRVCEWCGVTFSARQDNVAQGKARFCTLDHFYEWRRANYPPIEERALRYIPAAVGEECQEWTGACDADGYGVIDDDDGRPRRAARVVWELANGPMPDGHQMRHVVCDNPPCVRLDHLTTGTAQENTNDKVGKRRHRFGETHPRAKLTEDDVRAIRRQYAQGVPASVLGERYGVIEQNIYFVVSRLTWKHVD